MADVRTGRTQSQDVIALGDTGALRTIAMERRPALASIVVDRIREAIMFGELSLGEAVSEEKLAQRLGVSRTPVREALTALQLQGLIAILPQRGSYVFQPTEADIADICDYRALLETHAMKLAAARHRAELVAALLAANNTMLTAERDADAYGAAKADADYHEAFIHYSDSELLTQAYTLVSGRLGAIRFYARRSTATHSHSSGQHREIADTIAAGDLAAAERILVDHIGNMPPHYAEARNAFAAAAKAE